MLLVAEVSLVDKCYDRIQKVGAGCGMGAEM
jgi:hypothetical protein